MKKLLIIIFVGIPVMTVAFFAGLVITVKLGLDIKQPEIIYQLGQDILDGDMDWKWKIGSAKFYMCCRTITRDDDGRVRIKVEFVSQEKRLPSAPREW